MKTLLPVTIAAVFLLAAGEVLAQKTRVNLTPANLGPVGFAVTTAKRDDGAVDVTVTRDLSKARSFDAASNLKTVRFATLQVGGAAGVIVRCKLEPESAEGAVVYRFQIAPEALRHSRLTVWEIDDYKKSEGERLIGGGTEFTLELLDFVKP